MNIDFSGSPMTTGGQLYFDESGEEKLVTEVVIPDGTTKVKRNGGAASLQHAFTAKIFGPIAVFERVGSPRFPVEQKFGPSTGHMMQNEQIVEKMDETIRETFDKRVEHEILRVLNGWGG